MNKEFTVMAISNGNIYYLAKNWEYEIWRKEQIVFPSCIGSGYTTFKSRQAAINKFQKFFDVIGIDWDSDDKYFLLTLEKKTAHSEKNGNDYETFDLIEKELILSVKDYASTHTMACDMI